MGQTLEVTVIRKPQSNKLWTPAVKQYVVDHYMGMEQSERRRGIKRRAFMWEADGKIIEGNLTAFAEHVCQYFGIPHKKWSFTKVDAILVDAGLRVREFTNRTSVPGGKPEVIPEPESHIVGLASKRVIAEFVVRVYNDGSKEIVNSPSQQG